MRADALLRIRISGQTKREWLALADQHGVRLSDFVRTACRLGAVLGHQRLAEGLADIASARRDLHVIADELRRIADGSAASPDDLRAALKRVHATTDRLSVVLRGRAA